MDASKKCPQKTKQFKWTSEMVSDLLICLKGYKTKMEFQGLDFDGDRPAQYQHVRKEMAKIYDNGCFGPVEISAPPASLGELTSEEKDDFSKRKQAERSCIKKGHQRILEKLKDIRQNFSKAVTAGTRSGSGKFVYEFYDDSVTIWGGSATTEPLHFGTSSLACQSEEENFPSQSQVSDTCDSLFGDDNDDDDDSNDQPPNTSETPNSRKRTAPSNAVPRLIDNKRRHLEKALSSAQRDQIFLSEAKEDKEIRRDLGNSLRESSGTFTDAMINMSATMNQLGNSICKSIDMLAQAMLATNQSQVNHNMFYQNSGMPAAQPGIYNQRNSMNHQPYSFQQQHQTADEDTYHQL